MDILLNSGLMQVLGVIFTGLTAYVVAKSNRSGSREANQTTNWTSLVAALQKEVVDLRKEQEAHRALATHFYRVQESRYRWKYWGQRIVPLLETQEVIFPSPPETLEDTDPNLRGV